MENPIKTRENYYYVQKVTQNPSGEPTKEKVKDMRFGNKTDIHKFVEKLNQTNKDGTITYEY